MSNKYQEMWQLLDAVMEACCSEDCPVRKNPKAALLCPRDQGFNALQVQDPEDKEFEYKTACQRAFKQLDAAKVKCPGLKAVRSWANLKTLYRSTKQKENEQ